MMLSDKSVAALLESGDVGISPYPSDVQFQPVSVDLLLGTSFAVQNKGGGWHNFVTTETIIHSGQFLLANSRERIRLPSNVAGQVVGKSTWARQGLIVEAAGLVDPGFDGHITLELYNMNSLSLRLAAGVPICQMSFWWVDREVARPYGSEGLGSHYQGQTRAEPAR